MDDISMSAEDHIGCPACGKDVENAFGDPLGDPLCPHCGQLLWCTMRPTSDAIVLDVVSAHNVEHEDIERISAALIENESGLRVILNLGKLKFVSSSFVARLIALHKRLQAATGRLILCDLNPVIFETFHGAKLDKFFDIVEHEADAFQNS